MPINSRQNCNFGSSRLSRGAKIALLNGDFMGIHGVPKGIRPNPHYKRRYGRIPVANEGGSFRLSCLISGSPSGGPLDGGERGEASLDDPHPSIEIRWDQLTCLLGETQ
jgi:hypothetical protein